MVRRGSRVELVSNAVDDEPLPPALHSKGTNQREKGGELDGGESPHDDVRGWWCVGGAYSEARSFRASWSHFMAPTISGGQRERAEWASSVNAPT